MDRDRTGARWTAVPHGWMRDGLGKVAAQAGETWNFQVWFRDGQTSNFTNGVSVQFQ